MADKGSGYLGLGGQAGQPFCRILGHEQASRTGRGEDIKCQGPLYRGEDMKPSP